MFWLIIGSLAVILTKYYTSVGSRKLRHRINKVKLGLEHARRSLKDVREQEYDRAHDEEAIVVRVRYAKEIIDDLRIRLTTSEDDSTVVIDIKPISAPAVI